MLRHMRNQSRLGQQARFGEQARPDAAWVTSAVNSGHIAFVIKLCPTICAALLLSG